MQDYQHNLIHLLQEGSFRLRFMVEAKLLAEFLGTACPNPHLNTVGILELLVNAIEHGNLEISHEEKAKFENSDDWLKEIDNRLNHPNHLHKFVEVHFLRTASEIQIKVQDQGKGFNSTEFEKLRSKKKLDTHGRGIVMAKHLAFDRLEYSEKGNEVTAIILLR